nr:unnamed protein product [Callosobruchus analis]
MIMCFPIGIICAKIEMLLYAGRVLIGIASGSICVAAPLYISEISQAEIRGTLGIFFYLFMIIGILNANIFGYVLRLDLFNMSCAIFPLKFAALLIFQPESPVYYMEKDKPEKAAAALQRLRGKNYDCSRELKEIQATIDEEKQLASFKEAIKTKAAKSNCNLFHVDGTPTVLWDHLDVVLRKKSSM